MNKIARRIHSPALAASFTSLADPPSRGARTDQRALSEKSGTIVRLQAAFHSCLLICVAASHSAKQSCNVMLPPWAVIDAASFWAIEALEEPLLSASTGRCKEIAATVVAIATNQRR